tara:strand:+ start:2853 stop:3233 length:381 start_codon:yes stop_codon:yes gene_type:complete
MRINKYFLTILMLLNSSSILAFGNAFSQNEFDRTVEKGGVVLLHIHADWCSTCRAQDKILKSLMDNNNYPGLTIMEINFDTQKDLLKKYNVRYQSTLVLFKGNKELGSLTAKRNISAITSLLDKLK